jgi:predicted dehydrogenase
MIKVGIFGSGFGLYGYLPALLSSFDVTVSLPRRYINRLADRRDVSKLFSQIHWVDNELNVLDQVDTMILVQRPSDQIRWVSEILSRKSIKRILLEKPIAPNPLSATNLLSDLIASGKIFRIGYIFRYTVWGQDLLEKVRLNRLRKPIYITWKFKAHHYLTSAPNWKKMVSAGGGALRFFGIHLIGLLAEMGYSSVDKSESFTSSLDEAERWEAIFSGDGLPEVHVSVDSNSLPSCFIVRNEIIHFESNDPFPDLLFSGDLDRRIEPLRNLCHDLLYGEARNLSWYWSSVELWRDSEKIFNI